MNRSDLKVGIDFPKQQQKEEVAGGSSFRAPWYTKVSNFWFNRVIHIVGIGIAGHNIIVSVDYLNIVTKKINIHMN